MNGMCSTNSLTITEAGLETPSRATGIDAERDDVSKKRSSDNGPEIETKSALCPPQASNEAVFTDLEIAPTPPDTSAYTVFSQSTRRWIIALATAASFVSPLTANIYFPALNPIADDLGVSTSLINLTLTSYMIFQGVAPSFFGDFGDMAGRRPAYVVAFAIYIAANVGLALQHSYAALLVLRCIQSAGSSGALVLGFAVTADISSTAERGKYMGIVGAGIMIAPALGPVIGGIQSQYLGWRSIFWFCTIWAFAWLVLFIPSCPETCRNIVRNGSIPPQTWNRTLLDLSKKDGHRPPEPLPGRSLRFPNPLRTLTIIYEKEMAVVLLVNAFIYTTYIIIAATIATLFKEIYEFNDLDVGLCYLPYGAGCCVAVIAQGYILDWNYRRIAKKMGFSIDRHRGDDLSEFPIETARIQPLYPTMLFGVATLAAYGWALHMETTVAVPLVLVFFVGLAISASFNVLNTLIVDLHPDAPATASAANTLVRAWVGAAATAAVDHMIRAMSRGWCFTFLALLDLMLVGGLRLVDQRGLQWRTAKTMRG